MLADLSTADRKQSHYTNNLVCTGLLGVCVCVCVCVYSSLPVEAYITTHNTFWFKRASFGKSTPPGPALRGAATENPSESK